MNEPNFPKLGSRLVLSESMPLSLHGVSPLPELGPVKAPQEIEDRKGELRRIVKRLLAIIEDHRLSALRLGVTLDTVARSPVADGLKHLVEHPLAAFDLALGLQPHLPLKDVWECFTHPAFRDEFLARSALDGDHLAPRTPVDTFRRPVGFAA